MVNLTIMKLNLALKVEAPLKPTIESSVNEKKLYEDWEYSNSCCLMIIENHMEDSTYENIPKTTNAKEFLDAINKKYTKFSKNEKNKLSNNYLVDVCFESNIIDVSSDTWWLDSGATIHACNYMQAMISKRSPTKYVYMGDNRRAQVNFLGVVRLQLSTGTFLEL